MKAYYHDNKDEEDFRLPHDSGKEVSLQTLSDIGVIYHHFETESEVNSLIKEREYRNRDTIIFDSENYPGGEEAYLAKLQVFYKEHLHEDEEIRYILEGEGYFDVRDLGDNWVRTKLDKGDLLILPAGIYHRFTMTEKNFVKLLRLFKDEPKWVALSRPVDDNQYRIKYLQNINPV